MNYVLISPVRDEEALIGHTLESVCAQSVVPTRWIIVDNGSTDRTADIVLDYAKRFPWIELVSHATSPERSFAAKAQAFSAGLARLRCLDFEIIGNLDGDVSFDADYLTFLMRRFAEDPSLGVAGTPFLEDGYDSARDSFEGVHHVAGGVQMFRRQCFEEIGGYVPNYAGGIDWMAVTTARMKGWKTRSFPERRFIHYRTVGTATRGTLAAFFSYGEKDYYLGGAPLWQLCRVCYRALKRPLIVGGLAVALGYAWAALRGTPRAVSPELLAFHRAEQMSKLKAIIAALVRFKRVRPGQAEVGKVGAMAIALALRCATELEALSTLAALFESFGRV
jgi:glycosyltransferase involved in cell wall biosynthesis